VEVALVARIGIDTDSGLHFRLQRDAFADNQCTTRLDQCCIMFEAFKVCLFCSVDVQMVRVCGSDDGHIWGQPMEGTVELVCFDDCIRAFLGKEQVGAVILGDASEECGTFYMRLMEQVGGHGRSSRFTMSTGYTQSFAGMSDGSQYLCALLYFESVVAEIN